MIVSEFVVTVHSKQPGALIAFYQDVVGLRPAFEITPGAFMAGSSSFASIIIEEHSEIRGGAKEPHRMLLNFVVKDLTAEQQRLESFGVRFIRSAAVEPGVGIFATFVDPDGNYCQLVEFTE